MPSVSIIMPCYNLAGYISESIESVLCQKFTDWELIIVNDGSTDDSITVINSYVAKDNRIFCINQPNLGPSAARNNGINASKGKYILPLDADDVIASNYLEEGVSYLEEHPECTLFYCNAEFFGSVVGKWVIEYKGYKKLLASNSIFSSCIYRKTDFDRIGGYDVHFRGLEDWEFLIRLLYKNDSVFQSPSTLFFYRKDNNRTSISDEARARTNALLNAIYEKHKDKYEEYWGSHIRTIIDANNKEEKMHEIRNDYNNAVSSHSYKLGHLLLTPIRFFRKLFAK